MSSGADQRWRRADQPVNERAEACCAAMTFEEKVLVALGDFAAVAHLGVSPLQYTDGPNGIRGPDNVTAFPASLALAATGRSSRDTRGRAGFEVGARMPVGS
jgi:beta-glucosidase